MYFLGRKKISQRFNQFLVPKNDFENQNFAIFGGAVDIFCKRYDELNLMGTCPHQVLTEFLFLTFNFFPGHPPNRRKRFD